MDLYVQFGLDTLNLGDGGDVGNGDLFLIFFNRFITENEDLPALAGWAEMRIPSGDGSSGVDGDFALNLTRSFGDLWRLHSFGKLKTLNGSRGAEEEADRRSFGWEAGAGVDYLVTEQTVGVLNYIHGSSEKEGSRDFNILGLGLVHTLSQRNHLKLALNYKLNGDAEAPNFAAKIQWAYAF